MKNLLNIKIDNNLFKNNNIDNGLFNYNRDGWNSGEFGIIEKMIDCKIINIESYRLCSFNDIDIDKLEIDKFKAYHNEKREWVIEKAIAFYHLSKNYNVLINKEKSFFYIPELNLYLNHSNQTVLEFIQLCSIKNANIGIISSYKDNSDDNLTNSLSIRLIKVKSVFNLIYNKDSIFTPKAKKSRDSVPIIELRKYSKKRYDLVRAYSRYRKQIEEELKLHNQRSMVLKTKPIKYKEVDIDIVCQRFLNDIINKNLNK